jgi:hypothetical protein
VVPYFHPLNVCLREYRDPGPSRTETYFQFDSVLVFTVTMAPVQYMIVRTRERATVLGENAGGTSAMTTCTDQGPLNHKTSGLPRGMWASACLYSHVTTSPYDVFNLGLCTLIATASHESSGVPGSCYFNSICSSQPRANLRHIVHQIRKRKQMQE